MKKKQRSKVSKKFIPQASIVSDELFIPNHSGEHTAGTTGTPIGDRDIANKKYVDDNVGGLVDKTYLLIGGHVLQNGGVSLTLGL